MGELQKNFCADVTYHEVFEGVNHPVYCQSCCEVIFGQPAYVDLLFGDSEYYGMHKSCAELPDKIQHPLHPQHPLKTVWRECPVTYAAVSDGFICDGCRHYSWGFRYCCEKCDLNFDVRCVSKLESQQLALEERIEREVDFHQHKLQRFYYNMPLSSEVFQQIDCCYCSKGFQGSAYACIRCLLFIHESCLDKVRREIRSPFHLKHPLLLHQPFDRDDQRDVCCACQGWAYGLELGCDCLPTGSRHYHISCCTRATSGLRLKYHEEHPMLYVYWPYRLIMVEMDCVVCNNTCENCASYSCLDCFVFVHIECIPLPRVVKHECHPYHTLTLKHSTHVSKIASKEYHCVVCEKEGDLKYPFYCCEECPDIAHVDCVLSEENPPSEILEYLVPREKYKSEQQNDIDNKNEKLEEGKDKVQEPEHKKEGITEFEDCSLAEIDENIADVKKKMEKLAKELEVLQEIRAQKLNSLS